MVVIFSLKNVECKGVLMSIYIKSIILFVILCILIIAFSTTSLVVLSVISFFVLLGMTHKNLRRSISYKNKQRYFKSALWRSVRSRIKARDNYLCKRCGSPHSLEVHHITYIRFGRELPEDLVTLCRGCHQAVHNKHGYSGSIFKLYSWEDV